MDPHRDLSRRVLVVLLLLAVTSCKNVSTAPLSAAVSLTMPFEASLEFPAETREWVYSLPPQGAGPVTRYEMSVGAILQSYASDYLGAVFSGGPPLEVEIRLDGFRVRAYQAFVGVSFSVSREQQVVFEKSYETRGRRHPLQDDWGGTFEARQSVDLTTDEAMRSIFDRFLRDARAASHAW